MPRITEDGYFSVPVMSDLVTVGCECLKCGSHVANNDTSREMHKTWHLQMDELIEWAQSLDKRLFPQEVPSGETPSS